MLQNSDTASCMIRFLLDSQAFPVHKSIVRITALKNIHTETKIRIITFAVFLFIKATIGYNILTAGSENNSSREAKVALYSPAPLSYSKFTGVFFQS